jgi:hypothetical protein
VEKPTPWCEELMEFYERGVIVRNAIGGIKIDEFLGEESLLGKLAINLRPEARVLYGEDEHALAKHFAEFNE